MNWEANGRWRRGRQQPAPAEAADRGGLGTRPARQDGGRGGGCSQDVPSPLTRRTLGSRDMGR